MRARAGIEARHTAWALVRAAVPVAVVLSGCALPIQAEMDRATEVARFATHYDHALGARDNLLDRGLADCSEKTAKAETRCLRDRVAASGLSTTALVALVPGCRVGRLCRYDQTTRDRLGIVEANATDYVKHWRVTLDLRKPAADAARVPIEVLDRDDFDTKPGAGPGAG